MKGIEIPFDTIHYYDSLEDWTVGLYISLKKAAVYAREAEDTRFAQFLTRKHYEAVKILSRAPKNNKPKG